MGLFGISKAKDKGRDRRHERAAERTEDLYQSDLDRHLWSVPSRPERKERDGGRRIARLIASAAGMLGAAGLSYWVYRRLRDRSDSETDAPTRDGTDSAYYED